MNRIIINKGNIPVLIIAPHSPFDDENTDVIADVVASELKAYAVINIGWNRSKKALLGKNFANLNNIDHCRLDPVKKEFLNPILGFKNEIINQFSVCNIFIIHGVSDKIKGKIKDNVDIILGNGRGNPPSYSCSGFYKCALTVRLEENNFNVYHAMAGSRYAGWKPENINQMFVRHYVDKRVKSIQLEIVNSLRYDPDIAIKTSLRMAKSIKEFLKAKTKIPLAFPVKECFS